MKRAILTTLLVKSLVIGLFAQNGKQPSGCEEVVLNNNFSKSSVLKSILEKYTSAGLPGASLAVYTEDEGWWAGTGGYSRLESKTPMTNCNLQYLQSVSKTYLAVAIMKLYEEGRIKLDATISTYLPAKYSRYFKNAGKITVRMLLNHTSGIPEYSTNPEFVAYVILHPTTIFKMEESLSYLENEKPQFEPGAKHLYTNTNYLLLAIIADAITGDHAKYIQQTVFNPLQLNHTFYRASKGYLTYSELTNSYWDVLNCGKPANISSFQQANVATLKGDDGIVCTPIDAVKFLKGLFEGKILKDSTLKIMEHWVNNENGKPTYGLGLEYYEAGGLVGFGHAGGGIGAGCILLYVPEKKTYLFLSTNIGVLIEGEMSKKANEMENEILMKLLM